MFPPEDIRYRYNPNHKNTYQKGSVNAIQMQPVESTAIYAAGYDNSNGVMAIQFHAGTLDGKVYLFRPVPLEVWEAFMEAPSKGRFFQEQIRPNIGPTIDGGYEWNTGTVATGR